MATYKDIQKRVKKKHGYYVKTCWIAHIKEKHKLPLKRAPNRVGRRKHPCPDSKVKDIEQAFKHFGWIK